jgi:hypothetical protein
VSRGRLRLAPDEADQVPRLLEFRAAHPGVRVEPGEFGTWEARFSEGGEETTAVRHTLKDLLDKLDELLAET